MMVAHVLEAVKTRLNLNTSQQLAWDTAVAQTQAARQATRAGHTRVHDAVVAELAKPEPDLAAIAQLSDQVQADNRAQHVAVRNQWLAVYGMLSTEQKAVVRDVLVQRVARMDAFRSRMHERFLAPGGARG